MTLCLKNLVLRFLPHIDFNSDLDFKNRIKSLYCWCCCGKLSPEINLTHVLGGTESLITKVSLDVCFPDRCFSVFCSVRSFSCPYSLPDWMLLLNSLPSWLILILRFENFKQIQTLIYYGIQIDGLVWYLKSRQRLKCPMIT